MMKMSVRECIKLTAEALFFAGFLYIGYLILWYIGLILEVR